MQDFNIKCTVRKRNGTQDSFDINKILTGIDKSAQRSEPNFSKLTDEERGKFISALEQLFFTYNIKNGDTIETAFIEKIVGTALGKTFPTIQKTYQDYNNWKSKYADAFCKVKSEIEDVYLRGDRSNANTNSAYVSTKRCLGYNIFNKEMYQMNFLTPQELKVCRDGYIYIHDMVARNDTFNCMLFRMEDVMSGGFEMGDMWYTEPKTLDVAFDVMLAITKTAAAQQYGGFTIPRVDTLLAKYAEKSYNNYIREYNDFAPVGLMSRDLLGKLANHYAMYKVQRDLEQGFQAVEYDLNTIGSSRGDYPFVTMTFGLDETKFGRMVSKAMCKVRANGEGKPENRKIVAFPKLVFLYDEDMHDKDKEFEDVYNAVVECQSKAMYPDIESLTGEGYVPSIYKKYHLAISPMGCRAFLSPWFERGGMHPADDDDVPVFEGRANIGAISLNLPMIYQQSVEEHRDFYENLDMYLEMIRNLHQRTYEFLGKLKAGCNPMVFCQGGAYGGHLQPNDLIAPVIKSWTASFGITALNELQVLYNGKTIVEDGQFALEVLQHINDKVNKFKELDGHLYAIYSTPAEALCGTQVKQFRKKYGIIKGVSDKEYFTNSTHCPVYANITPFEKQDLEKRFWDLSNGGHIQYVRHTNDRNLEAFDTINKRAMKMGFYFGHNMDKCYCEDCGHEELDMQICPKCGSKNITEINRVCGYLGYSKIKGDSRMNDAKLAEIADRISM